MARYMQEKVFSLFSVVRGFGAVQSPPFSRIHGDIRASLDQLIKLKKTAYKLWVTAALKQLMRPQESGWHTPINHDTLN